MSERDMRDCRKAEELEFILLGETLKHPAGRAAILSALATARREGERVGLEKVAAWMMSLGMATGHGDTLEDLLTEATAHYREAEARGMERAAKVVDALPVISDAVRYGIGHSNGYSDALDAAAAIRAEKERQPMSDGEIYARISQRGMTDEERDRILTPYIAEPEKERDP